MPAPIGEFGVPVLDLAPEASPGVQAQLTASRDRRVHAASRRELLIEASVGALFLIAAVALALAFDSDRSFSIAVAAMVAGALIIADRVEFEVGSCYTTPTQIVFVPSLFLVPPEYVPFLVAIAFGASKALDIRSGRPPARCVTALGDASFTLGPVLVLLAAGSPSPQEVSVVTLLLALTAQLVGETLFSRLREWMHGHANLREQLLESAWIYVVDGMLSGVGFLYALASFKEPAALLLSLPLFAVLAFLARDRTSRISSLLELSEAYRGTARLLSSVIEHDDAYTGMHTRQVAELAMQVASSLHLTDVQRRNVEFGAMLHDVGKIAISKEIINKAGPLDRAEWQVMETHTLEGQRMLDQVGGLMSKIGNVVRSAHERYDGGGYPDGLAGESIPIESRIVFCCDAFNAMTTDRPYRRARSDEAAIAELRDHAGTQFDPRVVDVLVECLGRSAHPSSSPIEGATTESGRLSDLDEDRIERSGALADSVRKGLRNSPHSQRA